MAEEKEKLRSKLKAKAIIPGWIFAFCEMAAWLVRKVDFLFFLRKPSAGRMKTSVNFLPWPQQMTNANHTPPLELVAM